jgi:hypothetical protein
MSEILIPCPICGSPLYDDGHGWYMCNKVPNADIWHFQFLEGHDGEAQMNWHVYKKRFEK